MRIPKSTPPRVYLYGVAALAVLVIGFAIWLRADVRAALKIDKLELSIEAKPSNRP